MKSDDLDTDCAKRGRKVVIEVLLAQSVAMQIIATLRVRREWLASRFHADVRVRSAQRLRQLCLLATLLHSGCISEPLQI